MDVDNIPVPHLRVQKMVHWISHPNHQYRSNVLGSQAYILSRNLWKALCHPNTSSRRWPAKIACGECFTRHGTPIRYPKDWPPKLSWLVVWFSNGYCNLYSIDGYREKEYPFCQSVDASFGKRYACQAQPLIVSIISQTYLSYYMLDFSDHKIWMKALTRVYSKSSNAMCFWLVGEKAITTEFPGFRRTLHIIRAIFVVRLADSALGCVANRLEQCRNSKQNLP